MTSPYPFAKRQDRARFCSLTARFATPTVASRRVIMLGPQAESGLSPLQSRRALSRRLLTQPYWSQPVDMAIDYKTGISNAFSNIAAFVPKLIVAAIIIVIGYFIAKAISKALTKILQKAGFDGLVERGGVKKALEASEYDAAALLARVVHAFIMLFVLSTAFGVFGTNPISDLLATIIAYLPLVFIAIVILVIGFAVAAAAKTLIEGSLGGLEYGKTLANITSIVIVALFAVAALDELQIATNVVNALLYAVLVAAVGVVIVAVGGGGISTMSQRWQAVADKYDAEKPRMQEQIRNAPSVKDQAQQAKTKAQGSLSAAQPTPGAQRK